MKCMKKFCQKIVEFYKDEKLGRPNVEKLKKKERRYRTLAFPGCVGAVNCAGWQWEKCPVEWQILFTGKKGSRLLE